MEDSCGSPMLRSGMMGLYIYKYIVSSVWSTSIYQLGTKFTSVTNDFLLKFIRVPLKFLTVRHFIFITCLQIQGRYTSYRPLKLITLSYQFISRWNIFPIGNHLDRPCSSKSTARRELNVAAECCFAQLTASLTKHHAHCYGKHHHVQIVHSSFNSRRDTQNSYLRS